MKNRIANYFKIWIKYKWNNSMVIVYKTLATNSYEWFPLKIWSITKIWTTWTAYRNTLQKIKTKANR